MSDSNSSDIIQQLSIEEKGGINMQLLHFRDGKVLVLSQTALAFYQHKDAVFDELGGGFIAMQQLPESQQLAASTQGWVSHYKAGFVGLKDDKAILITPLAIQLFACKEDALYNRNEIIKLDIPA